MNLLWICCIWFFRGFENVESMAFFRRLSRPSRPFVFCLSESVSRSWRRFLPGTHFNFFELFVVIIATSNAFASSEIIQQKWWTNRMASNGIAYYNTPLWINNECNTQNELCEYKNKKPWELLVTEDCFHKEIVLVITVVWQVVGKKKKGARHMAFPNKQLPVEGVNERKCGNACFPSHLVIGRHHRRESSVGKAKNGIPRSVSIHETRPLHQNNYPFGTEISRHVNSEEDVLWCYSGSE